ncbi:hypothetical protein CTEN210_13306 [Chaetoceros tenuissimus]|uniref:Uncharacterized protein n=1 Tax=Chaetoceros tenuissimus TaxID=426638 RepID=A0AAD3D5B8_9STRA|nr:hypothetical protein CTEN210_13306 [Chaetoceros tenuissimus]
MKLKSFATFHLVLLNGLCSLPASSQEYPCPPPGAEALVDGENLVENCKCFYALAAAQKQDQSDTPTQIKEHTVMHYAPAGKYYGPDGITEYLSALSGDHVTATTQIGPSIPGYVRSIGNGQCHTLTAESQNMHLNPYHTVNNTEACASMTVGVRVTFNITDDPFEPIDVQSYEIWTPNLFVTEMFSLFSRSEASAEYICDKILNVCGDYENGKSDSWDYSMKNGRSEGGVRGLKKSKSAKASKSAKMNEKMKNCVKQAIALPDVTIGADGVTGFIDGNSRACRILHGFMAKNNQHHCPHVSFDPEVDADGKIKCNESAGILHTDVFTQEDIAFFILMGQAAFGFDEVGGRMTYEPCSVV